MRGTITPMKEKIDVICKDKVQKPLVKLKLKGQWNLSFRSH